MIDGMPSQTFSLSTLPPHEITSEEGRREKIIRLSRERYCNPRAIVEDKILRWSRPVKKLEKGRDEKTDEKKPNNKPEKKPKKI